MVSLQLMSGRDEVVEPDAGTHTTTSGTRKPARVTIGELAETA